MTTTTRTLAEMRTDVLLRIGEAANVLKLPAPREVHAYGNGGRCRVNDVFVEVTDVGQEESSRFRVHGARYDPTSDTVVVLAHVHYR